MSIEHSILAVISFTPATGYDIKSEFETKASSLFWGMSYGSIYPKLKNLEENGYIYSVLKEQGGRQKKQYELTKKGWIELENWLSEAPSYPSVKDELFMKLAAWHTEMDENILLSHLEKRKAESTELLQYVRHWQQNGTSFISSIGMIGIRYAEMKLETEIRWINESVEQLKMSGLPPSQDPRSMEKKLLDRRNSKLNS
ncbi:PadR family transcriptional regulator [Peribacillus frigoritolerans]|uniref:PadR family transcriptional regulator n=1 Tax=Peribacillus frigoritolerans TaxID=450367 RepID=UPI00105A3562|nr:PadR family transcriptional regulator [Peribacillus frigoritolerans]TDL83180.1 PadR family transcriptional regulator [Peribacillus frigoritolerans]